MMELVQNFPFMSIILSLFSGPLCSILNEIGRAHV